MPLLSENDQNDLNFLRNKLIGNIGIPDLGIELPIVHPPSHPSPPSPPQPVMAGITVHSESGDGITTEGGGSSVYSFSLGRAPTDNVTLTFTLSDLTEASLSSRTLLFTTANWNTPQLLTITGLDDFDDDGDISYFVNTRVNSFDFDYGQRSDGTGGVSVPNLQLKNLDDREDSPTTLIGDIGGIPTNDVQRGMNGKDRIYGKYMRDKLYGGRNDDRLYGEQDDDALWGDDGNDWLFGGEDDDSLYGGNGDDRLTGGEGFDLLVGGNGNDVYVIDDSFDSIDDQGALTDIDSVLIRGNITSYVLQKGIENGTIEGTSGISLTGNQGNNYLIGNTNNNVLNGRDGNDNLNAADGNDTVNGGDGNDVIIGSDGRGTDLYIGGMGVDYVDYSILSTNAINVNLATGRVSSLSVGTDTLQSIENVIAGSQNDTIIGSSTNNFITGGAGSEQLTGGAGADTFVYLATNDSTFTTAGRDAIRDFNGAAGDRIDLSSIDSNSQAAGNQVFSFIGSANFSGVRGQLRFASGVLSADINGDKTGDFAIAFSNMSALNGAWLFL